MIIDTLNNCNKYEALHPGFKDAFDAIKKIMSSEFISGQIDICGKDIYASLQEYNTNISDDFKFEAHNKYIDIQFLLEGSEIIMVGKRDKMQLSNCYDEEKDIMFYIKNKNTTLAYLEQQSFAIIFPDEPHAPGISSSGKPDMVKKIVVKVID
ncbi:MAG: YhcH/YjgK/YiaL family protein [Firmicutes bacterium]|nr:YhcH/YjgK/YiaL family protein [Bacillota bacterium]